MPNFKVYLSIQAEIEADSQEEAEKWADSTSQGLEIDIELEGVRTARCLVENVIQDD